MAPERLAHLILPDLSLAFVTSTSDIPWPHHPYRRLRLDAEYLSQAAKPTDSVEILKAMHPALRSRALESILKEAGVKEPEAVHIAQLENLIFSEKPSARADFPGGITLARQYDRLVKLEAADVPDGVSLPCPGQVCWGDWLVTAYPAEKIINTADTSKYKR